MRISLRLLLIILCQHAVTAEAQSRPQPQLEELKRLSIEELAETDVTGSGRRPEQLERVAASVTVITSDDLRRSGVMTVPQALRLADTMQVAYVGGPSWAISTRGFNITTANKMLVMIDGRTVYSPVFAGTFWEAHDLIVPDIERIEVVRGPGGTLWGANAVNGVIHIITKSAADTRGTFVNAAAGTANVGPFAVRHGGRFGGAGSYRVYAKVREEFAGELQTGGNGRDDHRFGQAGFRVESDRTARSHFTVQGDFFTGRTGLADDRHINLAGGNVLARWNRRGSRGETTVQGYYDHFYRRVPAQYRGVLDTFDLDGQHRLSIGSHALVVGGGYRQYRGDDLGDGPGFFFDPQRRVSHRSNVFGQAQLALTQEVFLNLGTRLEHNEFTGAELKPMISARWTRGPRTVWGSIAKAVRVPSRLDTDLRIRVPGTSAIAITGTDQFRSEELLAYEVGYRRRVGRVFSIDAAVYHNRYDDLRSQEFPAMPGEPVRLMNMLNATARGVEITSIAQPASWWQVGGGYNRLWKTFRLDRGSTDRTGGVSEANDPQYLLKLRSYINVGSRIEVDAFFRRIGALPQPAVPAYSELDARLGYRVQQGWELALIGTSLLKPRHLEFRGGTPPQLLERAVTLRSTWRF